MGINVPSKPRKNTISLVAEKVIIRKIRMRMESWINVRFLEGVFFWRCPVLAIRDTGRSHRLSMIRGVFTLSFVRAHPLLL